MSIAQPKGQNIRQAVKWISAEILEDPKKAITSLVQEACRKFNLSPLEEEFLVSFYKEGKKIEDIV